MKRFYSIGTFALLLSIFISCPQITHSKDNSLQKGKWALQFEIDRDFDISGFQGQTISVKKHTADNRAYRFGITVALEIGDAESYRIQNDTIRYPGDRDYNSRRLDINFQKIFYADVTAPVNLFYGVGVSTSFIHSKFEDQTSLSNGTYQNFRKSVANSWSAGVSGILGVEWFFAKDISLLGEYATFVNYRYDNRKEDSWAVRNGVRLGSTNYNEKSSSVRISASTVKFGLSVYF